MTKSSNGLSTLRRWYGGSCPILDEEELTASQCWMLLYMFSFELLQYGWNFAPLLCVVSFSAFF